MPAGDGLTDWVPLAGFMPVQAPLAVHAVPFVDQVRVALWPTAMLVGMTLKVTLAGGVPPEPPP
ncbi:MAG: hypothetical protein ACRETH_06505 [Steroidobacteraceae bacterium]